MMTLNLLTYTAPHKKTYDVLSLLNALGYRDITIWAIDMAYKKEFSPLILHRDFTSMMPPSLEKWALEMGWPYKKIESYHEIDATGLFLCCGAGILPKTFVDQNTVINAHPGYIPNVRGLDAFKWAVFEGQPIGVTTHVIGDEIDAGEIIERKIIPIYPTDTFHAAAQRVYETEIQMLVDVADKIPFKEGVSYISGSGYPVHRRMPHEKEITLLERFERYKSRYC